MTEQTLTPQQKAAQTRAANAAAKAAAAAADTQPQPQPVSLAAAAAQRKASKPKPVFRDKPGTPRVALADGRVGCVQCQLMLEPDGTTSLGPDMLTIPRTNADGSESGQRFPLAEIQLLADGFAAAGFQLV